MHRFIGALAVARAVIAGYEYIRAYGKAQEYVYDQVDQRTCRPNRRQRIGTRVPADYYYVRCVVQQLQYAGKHQRQRKHYHLRYQLAMGHIQFERLFLTQLHAIPLRKFLLNTIILGQY